MMRVLHEKVRISRLLCLSVAIVIAVFLATRIVTENGGDVMHVYDFWLALFSSDTYTGQSLVDVLGHFGLIAIVTFFVAGVSLGAGWLAAAISGSVAVVIRKRI